MVPKELKKIGSGHIYISTRGTQQQWESLRTTFYSLPWKGEFLSETRNVVIEHPREKFYTDENTGHKVVDS